MGDHAPRRGDQLTGVRVVELAQWVFVPLCGAVLADWGAEVIKIEHPKGGDAYRGLVSQGIGQVVGGVNPSVELANRGKRSVGVDITKAEGRNIVHRLVSQADVFLTNFRPGTLDRLGFGADDLQAIKPDLVYARGHGYGVRGPDRDAPGYDASAYWARGGMAHVLTPAVDEFPIAQRGAFGDRAGAMNLAFGITSALVKKERTGQGSIVDVSLLGTAMWQLASDVMSAIQGQQPRARTDRLAMMNPLVNMFRTSDDRHIQLVFLQPDRYWVPFCELVDRPDLAADPRFADIEIRARHRAECVAELDTVFAERTYVEWCTLLSTLDAPWSPIQAVEELLTDSQVTANGYIGTVDHDAGSFQAPTGPVQFDEHPPLLGRAPEAGEHTEQVLLEMGLEWDDIACLKKDGVIT